MAKKRKRRRRTVAALAGENTSTVSEKVKKKTKKYKRGTLIHKIYAYFDEAGIENVTYDATEKLAKKIKPDTAFNKYHYSWYKNAYKNLRDIP